MKKTIMTEDDSAGIRLMVKFSLESGKKKMREGKKAGATGWFAKSFRPDQLVEAVRKVPG